MKQQMGFKKKKILERKASENAPRNLLSHSGLQNLLSEKINITLQKTNKQTNKQNSDERHFLGPPCGMLLRRNSGRSALCRGSPAGMCIRIPWGTT